jgi:hypothetical protein
MCALKLIAMTLVLAASGTAFAATDGTLGAESQGSFMTSVTVLPSTANYVQILGLDDIVVPTIQLVDRPAFSAASEHLCLNKNTQGDVSVTFTFEDDANNGDHNLTDVDGHSAQIVGFQLIEPNGNSASATQNFGRVKSFITAATMGGAGGCNSASGQGVAHAIAINVRANGASSVGTLSAVIGVTLAPL